MGCIMMRVCHLNTCPVGIATQDPELREKFAGKPDHVVNFFYFVAEELRRIMAHLGFRTINEMVGQSDRLAMKNAIHHWKAKGLDFSKILYKPSVPRHVGTYCNKAQDHGLDKALDHELIDRCQGAIERKESVRFKVKLKNIQRTVGTLLSHEISKRHGETGLPEDTIWIDGHGSAGQSFCAFGAEGITFCVQGDANDYFGKGLSGAKLIIHPPETSSFVPEKNILIGNVAFYGAIRGHAYIRGIAGERFCVRNSGVHAVVEGVGDHGCEYMTGGRVVVLGSTGRNFAAGMSGGVAYVFDDQGDFETVRCNTELVDLEPLVNPNDIGECFDMITRHYQFTQSEVAKRILDDREGYLSKFVKVMPRDYKRALERLAEEENRAKSPSTAIPPVEAEARV